MIIDPSLLFGGASVQVAPRSKEDNSCAANASLWAGVVLSSRAFDGLEIPMFTGSVRTTRTSYDPKYGITTMYFTGKYRSWTNLPQKVQATVGLETESPRLERRTWSSPGSRPRRSCGKSGALKATATLCNCREETMPAPALFPAAPPRDPPS